MIRLVTRLLFVWFIKEKRLIAEELFVENRIRRLLNGYDRNTGDSITAPCCKTCSSPP